MNVAAGFRSKDLVTRLSQRIESDASLVSATLGRRVSIMEVCGTHTVAIYRYGLKELMPLELRLISGPGCPVCVTETSYIDRAIAIANADKVTVATFGDMVNVPGSVESLADARAKGASVKIVLSPLDALKLATSEPGRHIVFLAVGFETTAPSVAATVIQAKRQGAENFSILNGHKLVPPILTALMQRPDVEIDGLILPGHVSAVIGSDAYSDLPRRYGMCCAVTGFEPVDVLAAVAMLLEQLFSNEPAVANEYTRVVRSEGNARAQHLLREVFEPTTSGWRGIGQVEDSGLALKREFGEFDAEARFKLDLPETREDPDCECGEVLLGRIEPVDCPLFGAGCTPESPRGPCMVSSEGSCSACYKYGRTTAG